MLADWVRIILDLQAGSSNTSSQYKLGNVVEQRDCGKLWYWISLAKSKPREKNKTYAFGSGGVTEAYIPIKASEMSLWRDTHKHFLHSKLRFWKVSKPFQFHGCKRTTCNRQYREVHGLQMEFPQWAHYFCRCFEHSPEVGTHSYLHWCCWISNTHCGQSMFWWSQPSDKLSPTMTDLF